MQDEKYEHNNIRSLAQTMIASIDAHAEAILQRIAEQMACVREELAENQSRIAAYDNAHKLLNEMEHHAHQELEKHAVEVRENINEKIKQIKRCKQFNLQVGVSTDPGFNSPSMKFASASLQKYGGKLLLFGYNLEQTRKMNTDLSSGRKNLISPPTSGSALKLGR